MKMKLVALVSKGNETPRSIHFLGLPPQVTEDGDNRKVLSWPRVLAIEVTPDGIFLFRFAEDGSSAGDTWHANVDDAKHQAAYEYGNALSEWVEVPEGVTDVVAFAIAKTSAE